MNSASVDNIAVVTVGLEHDVHHVRRLQELVKSTASTTKTTEMLMWSDKPSVVVGDVGLVDELGQMNIDDKGKSGHIGKCSNLCRYLCRRARSPLGRDDDVPGATFAKSFRLGGCSTTSTK